MTERSDEWRMSATAAGNPDLDDLTQSEAESEEIEEASETGEEGQPPSPDEIRLRAYYRYMERQGGDDDEIADWLAAESELSQHSDAGRAADWRDERP